MATSSAPRASVLGLLIAYNDADVIEQSIAALRAQSYPLAEILLVDNRSTDGTLDRPIPPDVTVVRHLQNTGPGGAARTACQRALDRSFDWVWTLDADSAPRPDALETLIEFYGGMSPELQQQIGWIGSLPVSAGDGEPIHGWNFTLGSHEQADPPPEGEIAYECELNRWSGILFRMDVVKEVGLPNEYFYGWDMSDFEYCYRIKTAGYRAFVHTGSIIEHDLRGVPGTFMIERRLGPVSIPVVNLSPLRCYCYVRNNLHFWLYIYRGPRRLRVTLLRLFKCAKLIPNALLVPRDPGGTLLAALRGYVDGLLGRIRNTPPTVTGGRFLRTEEVLRELPTAPPCRAKEG